MKKPTETEPKNVGQAAAEWLVRLDSRPRDETTEAEFSEWLARHPDHEAAFARCEAAVLLTDKLRGDPRVRWAFEDAARIAIRGPVTQRAHGVSSWLRQPTLAWSVAGIAVAVATMAVVYRPQPAMPQQAMTMPPHTIVIPAQNLVPVNLALESSLFQSAVELPGQVVVDARSVAVLPFVTVSDGAGSRSDDASRLTDSLHEEVVAQLASVPGFYVIQEQSVLPYSELALMPSEVAIQLGVRGIVRGFVQVADDNIRVNVQLTDAVNDELLLEDAYDRAAGDLSTIRADIVSDIVLALGDPSKLADSQPL